MASDAWLGLVGVVVGGGISTVTQAIVARASKATQLDALDRQATHDSARAWRDDRRQIYADFLAATQDHAVQLDNFVIVDPAIRGKDPVPGADTLISGRHATFAAFSALSLVASADVYDVARSLLDFLDDCLIAAGAGATDLPDRPAECSHVALVGAMQADLGLPRLDATRPPSS